MIRDLRHSTLIVVLALAALPLFAQADTSIRVEVSTRRIDPLDMVTFPDTTAGTRSKEMEIRISNSGSVPLTFPADAAAEITGDAPGAFSITRMPGGQLDPYKSSYVGVVFTPPGVGGFMATVTVHSDDALYPDFAFIVSGYAPPNTPNAN